MRVDSKKLEYEPGTIHVGVPSSLGVGVGGPSYSNFLASTVFSCPQAWSHWFGLGQFAAPLCSCGIQVGRQTGHCPRPD